MQATTKPQADEPSSAAALTAARFAQSGAQFWTFIDKSAWPKRGPWDDEPDKVQWVDAATGLDCLIHRGPIGALCGYVGVPAGHPAFEVRYDEVDVDVHYGLTFSSKCQEVAETGQGICHVPAPGRPHDVWWLGFDCAHYGDVCPSSQSLFDDGSETYKDMRFVRAQCERLAAQLSEAA